MDALVEVFDVFGVQIQYWMLLAVALAPVAIVLSLSRQSS